MRLPHRPRRRSERCKRCGARDAASGSRFSTSTACMTDGTHLSRQSRRGDQGVQHPRRPRAQDAARRRHGGRDAVRARAPLRERRARGAGIVHVHARRRRQAACASHTCCASSSSTRSKLLTWETTCPTCRCCERCGLAFSVPDAPADVQAAPTIVTRRPAAHGAVREACELLHASAQGTLETKWQT